MRLTLPPGSKCEIPVTLDYGGLYIFTTWVSTADVQGEKSTSQKWIGPDYPTKVKNITLENNNGHIKLTWQAPSAVGQHGGFVDTENLTYVVSRDGGGMMKPVYLENILVFEEDIPADVTDRIFYRIRPVYKELVGLSASSKEISVGSDVRQVPFEINASSIEDFIVIDANRDGMTWKASWGYAQCKSGEPADDWLLTPQISLKAGQIYQLDCEVSAYMGFMSPQTLEIKYGIGDNAAAMTGEIDVVQAKTMGLTKFDTTESTFTVPADGDYRIGFHNISNGGTLGMSTISLSAVGASSGPAAPTSYSVKAAPAGELKATISFKAPDKDSEGNAISKISSIEVTSGSRTVGSVSNPTPGNVYSVDDNEAMQGENTYIITAIGEKGEEGVKSTAKGWVGLDIPTFPTNINMVEQDGNVVVSWTKPDEGIHGGYIRPEDIVYTIFEPTYQVVLTQVKGVESASIPLGELSGQSIVQLAISTGNEAGTCPEAVLTPNIVVGPAYTLPFFERFNERALDYSWIVTGAELDDSDGWSPVADKGPDGQPGVSTYWGIFEDEEQSLTSLRISLKDAVKPTLRFYVTGYIAEDSYPGILNVEISEKFDSGYKSVYNKEFDQTENAAWEAVEVPLDKYVGKEIFIRFRATPDGSFLCGVDDISIRSALDYDASMESIAVDKDEVEVGVTTAEVTARVQNHGVRDLEAGSYKVNFYAGDRMFASLDGKAMKTSFGQEIYKATYTPEMDDAAKTPISARIESDIDMNAGNNGSKEVNVYIEKPYCHAVDDLKGEVSDGAVVLTWSQPDQSGFPMREVTESFETYRNYSNCNAGDWAIIDNDKSAGTLTSYYFPGSNGPLGWVVLNPGSIPNANGGTHADNFPAYSGEQYMVAFTPQGGDSDDWLITTELSGRAQEVSFMARAESKRAGREMFEVYYSTTGTKTTDMTRLDDVDWRTTLEGWEEYKFKLPEGTKYFAVRCVSHNRLAMHIDEFKYESAPTPLTVVFKGYNVYRNGVRINDELLTSLSFRDTPDATDATYTVRAVYDKGEAAHSNPVTISELSLDGIYVDVDPETQAVYDLQGRRVYTMTEGEIYVTKGKTFRYTAK